MLRITPNSNADRAKCYYTSSDYYVDGQERAGVWRGEGAKTLGLTGEIERTDWDSLCDQLDPNTGEKLAQRRKDNRTIGYDFNFHAPKSLSVLYAATKDERLGDAFQSAVATTMQEIEEEMQTRVRKGGKNEDRRTGNMLWGEFIHLTARPVDGAPDPHLHAHCFAFNTTFDKEEGAWKAGQFRDLKRDAPFFEAMFHSRLSRGLAEMGLPIERTRKGWEIAGVPTTLITKFSRRTALIEEKAKEMGITDAAAMDGLGAKTRVRKAKELSMPQLQSEWRSRMSDGELGALARLEKLIGSDAKPQDDGAAAMAVEYAIGHEFERRSVIGKRRLLTTALKHAVGQVHPEQVLEQAERAPLIVNEQHGRQMVTTESVLKEEERIIAFAKAGRGQASPIKKTPHAFQRELLNDWQRQAVRHVLESRDKVMMVRGVAGVGKTTLMQEAVEAIESAGLHVVALAPTAEASRGVMRMEGFLEADTVARFLLDEDLQKKARGAVIWIDEAGLLGAKTMASVFDAAEKLDARVLLTGDARQHGSVERGTILRLLESEAGIKPAEVKAIQRQSGEYKAAIRAMADGKAGEGFDRLDALGWIKELPDDERDTQLASEYVDVVSKGKTALVVSPTHAEGERITQEIRSLLAAKGMIAGEERTFQTLQNLNLTEAERGDWLSYLPGDVLQFHKNAKGYARGQRVEAGREKLPLEHAERFSAYRVRPLSLAEGDLIRITQNGFTADKKHRLNNGATYKVRSFDAAGNIVLQNGWTVGKEFGHFTQGFVVTSFASQGKTVDRVLIGQSSHSFAASSREQFYVSCSRGKQGVTVYCDDKQALREAIDQSDDRMSAHELMRQHLRRQAELEQTREQSQPHERKREYAHER